MLEILTITGPIYITIALGFITTRGGLFNKIDMKVFGKFVINLALPAMLFKALAEHPFMEILNLSYLFVYAGASLLAIAGGYFWARKIAHFRTTKSVIYAMGMCSSNSGFVGYPILLLTLPSVAGVVLALNMTVENLLVIPLLLVLAEHSKNHSSKWYKVLGKSLSKLVSNPLIISLAAGVTVSLMGLKIPEAISRSINLFAMASGGISLFVIGGTLVGLSMRGSALKVMPIVIGKLIFHPLAIVVMVLVLPLLNMTPLGPSLKVAAVLMAAMPMMSIYPILAQAYDFEELAATTLLIATIMSFFTTSALFMLHNSFPNWG